MPFDPEDPVKIANLLDSVEWSQKRLQKRREQRLDHLKQYVGHHYGEEGAPDNVPVNMIELGVNIFQRAVAAHAPKAMIESNYPELLPAAADMELALNQEASRIRIKDSFNTCAREALFCMGLMEVGITTKDTPPDGEGYLYDPGHVFADPILFEDSILDMTSKFWDQQSYLGHEFSVNFEWAKDNDQFDSKARAALTNSSEYIGLSEDVRSESLSQGSRATMDEFEETIRLRQLFLPRQQLVMLFSATGSRLPLSIIQWEGPERGPYHRLSFGDVQGNLVPLAPVPVWIDLHDMVNRLANKAGRQAERQKTITGVRGSAEDDGNRVLEAKDGQMIKLDDPDSVREFKFGGANQETLGMVEWSKKVLETMGGNWPSLAGLGASSRTVGQDKLINEGASARLSDMQQTMVQFQSDVMKDLAFWMWNDPISEYHLNKPIQGTKYSVPIVWSPETRVGKFTDYLFKVNPYSGLPVSPEQEASEFLQLLTNFVLPAMPYMQQQGIGLNWEDIFKTIAKYQNKPELLRALVFTQGEQQPKPQLPPKQASTTRNYVRENRPGASYSGQQDVMIRQLFGGQSQQSEEDAMARPLN